MGRIISRCTSKLYKDKCHLLIVEHKYLHKSICTKIGQTKLWKSKKQKLLGVQIHKNLSFDEYFSNIWKKASRKLSYQVI